MKVSVFQVEIDFPGFHASSLQSAQPRKTNSQRIYRRDVALTFRKQRDDKFESEVHSIATLAE